LRQFGQEHPQTSEAINQVMGQIRSIAVLHGLQGHASMDTVRLCELTSAIATDVASVWQTPIAVDIPDLWTPGIIAEKEAVPVALVLNELLVNAVKHGGKAHGHVSVSLRKGQHEEQIRVTIRNSGRLRSNLDRPTGHHSGLQLINSLMPHAGASLSREQQDEEVLTRLELEPPVIRLEVKQP
jgi:two-component system, sensor histidine kinase PdtaS